REVTTGRNQSPGLCPRGRAEGVRPRHAFTTDDADAIRRLCPDVKSVAVIGFVDAVTLSHGDRTTRGVQVIGADEYLQEVNHYDPWMGRFFTGEEIRRRDQVVVLGKDIREALVKGGDPIGKTVHIDLVPFAV